MQENFSGHEQSASDHREIFNRLIQNAPPISPVDRSKAPFRDYSENTPEQWKYVRADEVEAYLKGKRFFDTGLISRSGGQMKQLFEVRASNRSQLIKVPLDLVVNAKGFESWNGRNERNTKSWYSRLYGGGESKSIDVIQHYAGLSTDLPPVAAMLMFIQPDGKVFFDNCSGDSHRISAAILRGNDFIETSEVYAYLLSEDYL